MSATFAGLTVVVTRPRRQAAAFIAEATRAGAACIALPAIEIEYLRLAAADRDRLAPDAHDWAIFTSANAVEAALGELPPPTHCRIAAVGRATARALESHGLVVHALPEGRSDSEGLLALPMFANLRDRRVVILRGVGGRELLREELQARGATVDVAELYRREAAQPDARSLVALEAALASGTERVVAAVTSVEVLDGLLGMLPDALGARVRRCALLLPGERVALAARERQWQGPLLVSPSAEDAAMLATLKSHVLAQGRSAPA